MLVNCGLKLPPKAESTFTLRERQFYIGTVHNSGQGKVDMVLKEWRGVYDIA
ncbi:hypothetical protein PILCRDRAFT_818908 [Piloderma croceum F 1598]|uniref:Uncharacterized protein n=1 Tax=Piloderma croceum (strain F 1598) TaxID=765440 RepID=A0A0C3G041_PILCF|nr:hypothetical protein PILCRDRAFT_818908 [Piloderma croceum F 1598]